MSSVTESPHIEIVSGISSLDKDTFYAFPLVSRPAGIQNTNVNNPDVFSWKSIVMQDDNILFSMKINYDNAEHEKVKSIDFSGDLLKATTITPNEFINESDIVPTPTNVSISRSQAPDDIFTTREFVPTETINNNIIKYVIIAQHDKNFMIYTYAEQKKNKSTFLDLENIPEIKKTPVMQPIAFEGGAKQAPQQKKRQQVVIDEVKLAELRYLCKLHLTVPINIETFTRNYKSISFRLELQVNGTIETRQWSSFETVVNGLQPNLVWGDTKYSCFLKFFPLDDTLLAKLKQRELDRQKEEQKEQQIILDRINKEAKQKEVDLQEEKEKVHKEDNAKKLKLIRAKAAKIRAKTTSAAPKIIVVNSDDNKKNAFIDKLRERKNKINQLKEKLKENNRPNGKRALKQRREINKLKLEARRFIESNQQADWLIDDELKVSDVDPDYVETPQEPPQNQQPSIPPAKAAAAVAAVAAPPSSSSSRPRQQNQNQQASIPPTATAAPPSSSSSRPRQQNQNQQPSILARSNKGKNKVAAAAPLSLSSSHEDQTQLQAQITNSRKKKKNNDNNKPTIDITATAAATTRLAGPTHVSNTRKATTASFGSASTLDADKFFAPVRQTPIAKEIGAQRNVSIFCPYFDSPPLLALNIDNNKSVTARFAPLPHPDREIVLQILDECNRNKTADTDFVVSTLFDSSYARDLACLHPTLTGMKEKWLNGDAINNYLKLLEIRNDRLVLLSGNKRKSTLIRNAGFEEAFKNHFTSDKSKNLDHQGVLTKAEMAQIKNGEVDKIIIPFNLSQTHWVFFTLFFGNEENKYVFYDFYTSSNVTRIINTILKPFCKYLDDSKQWVYKIETNIPTQPNQYDCGVYLLAGASLIADNIVLTKEIFSQNHIDIFRTKIAHALILGKLDY